MNISVGNGYRLNQYSNELKKLKNLEKKVSSIPVFDCDEKKLKEMSTPHYFQLIPSDKWNGHLGALMRRFLLNVDSDQIPFKNIFEKGLSDIQLKSFFNRLSNYIILKNDTDQKKILSNLFKLTSLKRIQTISIDIFPPHDFNKDLLKRIKADAILFPRLSQYQPPLNVQNELKIIWDICTQDAGNFLEAFEILSKNPTTTLEATSLINMYKLSINVVDGKGSSLAPFAINALRKLFLHYCTTTPSSLEPLIEYSDPNFYKVVPPINNRNRILSAIFSSWNENVTPILIGEAGSGKTSLLIEVARRVNKGTIPGMQSEDYKAFGGSACSLANSGNANMEKIFGKVCKKKEHTILLLDEIQAFNEPQKTLLRTYFDGSSPQSIRYALFATTPQGANEFYKNDDRKFKKIHIPNLSEKETKVVLHNQARFMAPHLIVDPLIIDRIVKLSEGRFSEAQKMLFQVIRNTLNQNTTPLSASLYDSKNTQIDAAAQQHLNNLQSNDYSCETTSSLLDRLEEERKELADSLNKEKLDILTHALLLAKRSQLTLNILGISKKILTKFHVFLKDSKIKKSQIDSNMEMTLFGCLAFQNILDNDIKKFIYYNYFLKKALCKRIKGFENEHNLISTIKNNYIKDEDLKLED